MSTVVVTSAEVVEVQPDVAITSAQVNGAWKSARAATQSIVFTNCSTGLGVKIIGGASVNDGDDDGGYGVFVKRVIPGGVAAADGRLQQGDLLLSVNGESLQHVTNESAVSMLRKASSHDYIDLLVCRDECARADFLQLLSAYSYSSGSSSLCEQRSVSSRNSTPSLHDDRLWSNEVSERFLTALADVSSQGSTPRDHQADAGLLLPGDRSRSSGVHSICSESSCESESEIIKSAIDCVTPPPLADFNMAEYNTPSSQHRNRLSQPAKASTPFDAVDGATGIISRVFATSPRVNNSESASHRPRESDSPFTSHDISAIPAAMPDVQPSGATNLQEIALDENVRLKIEKLEVALRYLGLKPSLEQQTELRRRLVIEADGAVTYGQFVSVARDLFSVELDEREIGRGPQMADSWGEVPAEQAPPHPESAERELQRLRREKEELKRETERLKTLLREKENSCNMAEEELLRVRREAQGALHESRALRSQVALAEQAQQASRAVERDYEEVVRALEGELVAARASYDHSLNSPAVQKRLTVLSSQLRKMAMGKKTYEVATDKLIHFVELVHETLSGQGEPLLAGAPVVGEAARASRPPSYAGRHRRASPTSLATQARDVVMAVKELLEADPLPFGWDEAYTSDGMKYYINHVTQTTAWQHPVSRIHHGDMGGLASPPNNGVAETQT